MPSIEQLRRALSTARGRERLLRLYGTGPGAADLQVERYSRLLARFATAFPEEREVELFSAPGRAEIGGNHTDHNGGRVLAAAVDMDIVAAAAKTGGSSVVIDSEGYPRQIIELADLAQREAERYKPEALTRGVCARMRELGYRIGGFRACLQSRVPQGSGLSSSAAYEVLLASILNAFYNDGRIPELELARLAQYAENRYFGKPCGLMDQTTCLAGGLVSIDFRDFAHPLVRKLRCDFASSGYSLVIVNTGPGHEDLHQEYASIEGEMKAVARALGGDVLRELDKDRVLRELPSLRGRVGDRAILRALHFYDDDRRVEEQVAALERADFPEFLRLVVESGRSSWTLCQNCYPQGAVREQGVALALALSQTLLSGSGAWRVHGGGFAGTIQAFVQQEQADAYLTRMRGIFGPESCHQLSVCSSGASRLEGMC
jgi:galactokinase